MATEITEFRDPPIQFGNYVPVRQLPALRHTQLTLGNVLTVGTDTTLLSIVPGEDCRLRVAVGNGTQADPAAPGNDCIMLKSGVRSDFAVSKGMKLIFA